MIENDILTQLKATRYTQVPFPPYRYVPGKNPHPITHPDGHSHRLPGVEVPPVPLVSPEQWRESEAYLFGCDLYNHAYWWEALESWEGLWHRPERGSAQREFLQGLIQVAACHLDLYRGRLHGVAELRGLAIGHLTRAIEQMTEAPFMGLEVRAFMVQIERYYEDILGTDSPVHRVEIFPFIQPQL